MFRASNILLSLRLTIKLALCLSQPSTKQKAYSQTLIKTFSIFPYWYNFFDNLSIYNYLGVLRCGIVNNL